MTEKDAWLDLLQDLHPEMKDVVKAVKEAAELDDRFCDIMTREGFDE